MYISNNIANFLSLNLITTEIFYISIGKCLKSFKPITIPHFMQCIRMGVTTVVIVVLELNIYTDIAVQEPTMCCHCKLKPRSKIISGHFGARFAQLQFHFHLMLLLLLCGGMLHRFAHCYLRDNCNKHQFICTEACIGIIPSSFPIQLLLTCLSALYCRWHIKLITHVIILAEMKYATIYNRGQTRLEVPAVSNSPYSLPQLCSVCCSHFTLLVKMRQIRVRGAHSNSQLSCNKCKFMTDQFQNNSKCT